MHDLALLSKSMPLLAFPPPTIFPPWRGDLKNASISKSPAGKEMFGGRTSRGLFPRIGRVPIL
jgi:hypothetical protein